MKAKVRLDAHGVWFAQPYLGKAPDGRQVRPRKSFPDATSHDEAQAMADEWLNGLTLGGQVESGIITDLLWRYIDTRAVKGLSVNTQKRWRLYTRTYVDRYLGSRLACDLSSKDLDDFEQKLLSPKERGGQGLCQNTVIGVHYFLRGAYRYWVSLGLVASNPMLNVSKPKANRHEAVSVDEWDLPTLSKALKARFDGESVFDARAAYAFGAWLALSTGMRCGEVCALRRRDVKPASRSLYVGGNVFETDGGGIERSPVTKNGRTRSVQITVNELETIRRFISKQSASGGLFTPDTALVSVDGAFLRPTTLSRAFSRLRDELKLPKACTFHSLRHTHATWVLANGIDLKTLSERLGHADEATTLRLYAHLMPGRDAAAAQAFENFIDGLEGGVNGV